jgi:DNA polymerase-3 subunit epsilon
MRQIVLDTETTGLEVSLGHRVIEIGCVELVNRRVTGNHWHYYFNPEREIDAGAYEVHGISNEFLQDKHRFADLASDFHEYVRGAELIIHNASFDLGFLNHELGLLTPPLEPLEAVCGVLDTLLLARQKHPGQKNNLDALCKRYDIDNSQRSLHGALLDARILADVYLVMTGGQTSLGLDVEQGSEASDETLELSRREGAGPLPLWPLDEPALQANREYVEFLADKHPDPAWK